MAVLLILTMPEGVPEVLLDEVQAEMDVKANPPAGLIAHVHHEHEGRVRVVDIWTSRQAYDTFSESRLTPAMARVAERHGMDLAAAPEPTLEFFETSDPVIGH